MSEETLYADGFEDAFLGLGRHFNRELAVYDLEKCIKILMERDGMDEDEAIEFLEFNTLGAWVGEHTPIFLTLGSLADARADDSALHPAGGDHAEPG